jgi:hypothetical protein
LFSKKYWHFASVTAHRANRDAASRALAMKSVDPIVMSELAGHQTHLDQRVDGGTSSLEHVTGLEGG